MLSAERARAIYAPLREDPRNLLLERRLLVLGDLVVPDHAEH